MMRRKLETNTDTLAADVSPAGFISWALRIIPSQTKFVLSGVVVFAAAALVLGWVNRFSLSLTFSISTLILVFGVAASAISAASKVLVGVGSFLAWSLAILFIALLALLMTSAFFGVPPAGARMLVRALGSYEILTQSRSATPSVVIANSQSETFDSLPQTLRTEPSNTDIPSRIQELASLPELVVSGALRMSAPGEKRVLSASTLRLDGGTLITNGGDLIVEVNNLISDNGKIRAFENSEMSPSNAAGRSGGRVTLIVHGAVSGGLTIDLRGEKGAVGLSGTDGGKGSKGERGANAASGVVDCRRGAGGGGQGGQGQAGTDASPGFPGGKGGILIVHAADVDAAKRVIGTPLVDGGKGGNPGTPGKGGEGGDGGDGGSPIGLCSGGGPTGAQGSRGPNGQPRAPGKDGDSGSVVFTGQARA